jgi:hypothetical protein
MDIVERLKFAIREPSKLGTVKTMAVHLQDAISEIERLRAAKAERNRSLGPITPEVFWAADQARTIHLRDVDANDQMGALTAALEAAFAAAGSAWQPIETAPSYRYVLTSRVGGGVVEVATKNGEGLWKSDFDPVYRMRGYTHWQDLPKPPPLSILTQSPNAAEPMAMKMSKEQFRQWTSGRVRS